MGLSKWGATFKRVRNLINNYPSAIRLILSATPVDKNPMEYRWLMYLLAVHREWAWGVWLDNKRWREEYVEFQFDRPYRIRPEKLPEVLREIRRATFVQRDEEKLEFPASMRKWVEFDLSPEAQALYEQAESKAALDIDGAKIRTAAMKLHQMTSGYVLDDEGKVVRIGWDKLRTLLEVVRDRVPQGEKVIIWCHFREDMRIAPMALVRKYGEDQVLVLRDGMSAAEHTKVVRRFSRSGGPRFLVASVNVASHAIDLTAACWAIYYSVNYSYKKNRQAVGRISRPGQTREQHHLYLVAKGTIDRHLHRALRRKGKTNDMLRDYFEGKVKP